MQAAGCRSLCGPFRAPRGTSAFGLESLGLVHFWLGVSLSTCKTPKAKGTRMPVPFNIGWG
eukprot:5480916-Prorocentrum_lima.AAC.1